ncbi:MAG TPA: uroporphyrinogen-III synthase, partial [Salinimicrobium sp.]|nr:uroporphyrinogen-III synthase [Salinimicrobium sp.]
MGNKAEILTKSKKFSVLSTKKLTSAQKELLLNAGIGLVERNFIRIVPIDFSVEKIPENVIFTSQNTVKFVLEKLGKEKFESKKIFCVGEKTAGLLEKSGLRVTLSANYGKELAMNIQKGHSEEEFLFFCGKKRRPELPDFFKKHKIQFSEIHVYDTKPNPKKLNRKFDGILFYSPSGVKSFCSENEIEESIAF